MPQQRSSSVSRFAVFTTALALACCGCKARELGANYADTQSETVDNSWVSAVEACWPAVAHQGYSTAAVKYYLADPLHFRAAFTGYATLNDDMLRTIVAAPVSSAPPVDTSVLAHTEMPVLTRVQAAAGVTNTAGRATGPDSFCSIQPGLPVGFR
jgi:hypothetical protein